MVLGIIPGCFYNCIYWSPSLHPGTLHPVLYLPYIYYIAPPGWICEALPSLGKMNYQQQLANSAAIRAEIQRFESVHPNIYSIYELLERLDEPALQNQIREHVIAIEGKCALWGHRAPCNSLEYLAVMSAIHCFFFLQCTLMFYCYVSNIVQCLGCQYRKHLPC